MRTGVRMRRIAWMGASESAVRVVLDLEPDSDPISGFLEHDGETRHRFWGWLELLAAIEVVRKEQPSATNTDAQRKERR
jgi:hypothetical protein